VTLSASGKRGGGKCCAATADFAGQILKSVASGEAGGHGSVAIGKRRGREGGGGVGQ
jgi:hypothetical protein